MESENLDVELQRIKEAILQEMQRKQNSRVPGQGITEFHRLTAELMMGSPVVKQAVDHEVQRIAAAFDAPEVATFDAHPDRNGGFALRMAMHLPSCVNVVKQPDVLSITVGSGAKALRFGQGPAKTTAWGGDQESRNMLLRALFKMGYEDPAIDQALGGSLSNHEKMELRLSFPREFWSPKWLDEEKIPKQPTTTM